MGIATIISRLLGLVRDTLIGHILGAKWISDAYYVAYRIPNVMRQLLGEGALSSAFIPVFCKIHIDNGKKDAFKLAQALLFWLYILLMALSIFGMIFSPYLVKMFTFSSTFEEGPVQIAVTLTRIMFPFFIFIGLAAITMAILNSLDHFFIPALAPATFNIVLIAAALAAPYFSDNPIVKVKVLAVGVLIGGFGQFVVMIPSLLSEKFPMKVVYSHDGLKKILKMMIPATIGQSVVQVTLVVNTMLGWLIGEGAITALNYGNRLMNFPLGVLGVSISQTAVPTLSRQIAQNDMVELKKTLNYLVRIIGFVMIPASAGLMVLSTPIIRLLFQHGQFDVIATIKTSNCLFYFATGLSFYTLVKVLAPIFYAFSDTKTPVIAAVISMICNIIINLILMKPMGESGLALSTAITSFINISVLFYFLKKRIGNLGLFNTIPSLIKILFCSSIMALATYFVADYFNPATTLILRVSQVLTGVSAGIIIYFSLTALLGLEEYTQAMDMIKKRLTKK